MNNDDKLNRLTPEQEMIKNSPLFLEIYKGQEGVIDHLTKMCPFLPIGTNNEDITADVLEIIDDGDVNL